MIESALFEQFSMGACFPNLAVMHDDDSVGVLNGREAVGDDDGGPALHEFADGVLDEGFGFGIDAGGGFVEDEDFHEEYLSGGLSVRCEKCNGSGKKKIVEPVFDKEHEWKRAEFEEELREWNQFEADLSYEKAMKARGIQY